MPKRFYLPSTGAADASPAYAAAWEATSFASRLKAVASKIASPMTTVTGTPGAGGDILFRQYVSDPLIAQTISAQAIKFQMRAASPSYMNLYTTLGIRVVSNDGSIVRGTILAVTRDDTAINTPTLQNRKFTATSSSVDCQDGDRLVFEVGVYTANAGFALSISIGDDNATNLPEDDTATAAYNPWIEFTNNISLGLTQTETIQITEALQLLASKAVAENISLADVMHMLMSSTEAETLTIDDACEALKVVTSTQAEALDINDFIELIYGKVLSEGITVADAIIFVASKVQAEDITLSDVMNVLLQAEKSETITVADAISKAMGWKGAEGVNISDIMNSYIFIPNKPLAKYSTRILIDMLLDSGTKHFSTEDLHITE